MPLSELIIDGFKSFPDKTNIHFGRGITGIVGPNGSGKSNITEAIRWAMGESSAKQLRGSNMKDVIFAGSQLRKPLSRAQVTLVFDNHKRELASPADEVSVSREIFASGENNYYINHKSVRLKDVRALFLDSGISENSLAIISQGRVDEILNSKPEQRRGIFEEAAGVLHFKWQKEQAETQLEKTNDNLIRINDLVKELSKRLPPLAEQSSLAKEYRFQKAGLDRELKVLLALEIQNLNQQKEGLEQEARKNQSLLTKLDQEVKQSQAHLTDKKKKQETTSSEREQLQAQFLTLNDDLADLKTKLQIAAQNKQYNQATKKEYQSQESELKGQVQKVKGSLLTAEKTKKILTSQKDKLERQYAELKKKGQAGPEELEHQLDKERDDYIQILQDQTSNNNRLVYLQTELKRSRGTSNYEQEAVRKQLQSAQANLQELSRKGEALKAKVAAKKKKVKRIIENSQQKEKKMAALSSQVQREEHNLEHLRARQEALLNIQKRHEGYYYGVRSVLNHLSDYPGVIGAVGELLTFPPELEAAMTTALGGGVQDLVVKSKMDARDAINQLKQNHAGRATFLPLDNLSYRSVPSSTVFSLKTIAGFKGVASELVKSETKQDIRTAINFLLGRVLIVDTIDTAMAVSRQTRRYRIVTLDGDVISPGGSMTGGTRNQRSNSPLRITGEITQLSEKVAALKGKFIASSSQLSSWQKEKAAEQEKMQTLRRDLQLTEQSLGKAALSYQNQQKEVKRLADANDLYQTQNEKRAKRQQHIQEQIEEEKLKQTELKQKAAEQKKVMAQTQAMRQNTKQLQETLRQKTASLSSQIAVLTNKLNNLATSQRQEQQQLTTNQKQLAAVEDKLSALSNKGENSADNKAKLGRKQKELLAQQQSVKSELGRRTDALGELEAQIDRLNQVATRNYDLRKDAAAAQEDYSVKIAQINEQMNHRLKQLSQSYSLTYEAALKQAKIENTTANRAALAKKVKLHRMSLTDIGPVNLEAIGEYDKVKKRYDFLNQQQNDLLKARKNLRQSMTTLDGEVEKRFAASFDKIAASFARIFPLVFNGGKAQLVLTAPDDLLKTGIEIIAQPPGKKLQRLSLLSGGERALTAITLLFAMLRVNPVPFCVLDEVEAALDEANVARFADFLQKYDLHTQFIVITHRRGTMARADQLFGVVMQESGVSQVLSVSLKDIKNEVKA